MHPLVYATIAYFLVLVAAALFRGKKLMALPLWLQGAIFLPALAGMFYTVWWMQNEETKKEAVFMDVCWGAGVAHYPETPETKEACPGGVEKLSWPQKTITVYWGMDINFGDYIESHVMAMEWWNKHLGWNQFVPGEIAEDSDVVIIQGGASESGAMSTSHSRTGSRITATITVKKPGNIREWMLQEQHELGHVLGLAHDRSGIMKRNLSEGEKMKVWHLHDKDRDAIRSLH